MVGLVLLHRPNFSSNVGTTTIATLASNHALNQPRILREVKQREGDRHAPALLDQDVRFIVFVNRLG